MTEAHVTTFLLGMVIGAVFGNVASAAFYALILNAPSYAVALTIYTLLVFFAALAIFTAGALLLAVNERQREI